MAVQILAPTTAAGRSKPFVVRTERWVTVIITGFATVENGFIDISPDGGKNWVKSPFAQAGMDVNTTSARVNSPGLYSFSKGGTISPAAVYIATEENA